MKKIIVCFILLGEDKKGFDFEEDQLAHPCVGVIVDGPIASNYFCECGHNWHCQQHGASYIFNCGSIGIAGSMVIIVLKLSFVLMECVALPAVSDNSKKINTHGVSDESGNLLDSKLIIVD